MVEFKDIYSGLEETGAVVFPFPVGERKSATIEYNKKYGVFVDFLSFSTMREAKSAMTHENGHSATGTTHKLCSPYQLIIQHEYSSNKWKTLRYLPVSEFQKAFAAGYTRPWELVEWFDLLEEDILWALSFYINNGYLSTSELSINVC